jgi:hypothetical protein
MFYKQKDRLRRWWFVHQTRCVLDSAPIELDAAGPTLLSQLQHKDVQMYLAAIKSFARRLPPSEVHIVDDGSLTNDDRALLGRHVAGMVVHDLKACREPGLPIGGCWERLIAIAHLSETRYVIQLDADTLTLGGIPEVADAVRSAKSFSIGTWDGQTLEPATDRARAAQRHLGSGKPHVQMLSESKFDRLQYPQVLRYVRGCAGFSGFAPGGGKLRLMKTLSAQLSSLIGDRWQEWGSEQVMSNLVVANQPKAIVLPHPEYADCEKMLTGRTCFVHFIGTCRFRGGVYARLANKMSLAG